jgi:DUF4097 and DUF4098 domain-containing protein YvlB
MQKAARVESKNGAVSMARVRGEANVITSFAAVTLDDIAGPIQVENKNGPVEATSAGRGECQPIIIRTSFSSIRVRLNGEASYRVAAKTAFGKIRTDFPLNVSVSGANGDSSGTIGSGRCEMRLTDSYGNIEILKGGSPARASNE